MNKLTKNLAFMTTAAAVTTIVVSAPSTADAEASLSSLVFEYQDDTQFTVTYSDYVDAIIAESGNLYNLIESDDVKLVALGVNGSTFVNYSKFVNAFIDDSEDRTAKEVLEDVSSDASYTIDEDTVTTYETITGFNDDGAPFFEEAETPEVISID